MPYGIFQADQGDYRLFQTDLKGQPVGRPLARRTSKDRALKLLPQLEAAKTATFEVLRDVVAHICPDCAAKMDERGWKSLKVTEGKAAAGDLLQGLCDVMAPMGSEPWGAELILNGLIDPDTFDMFELWVYHACMPMSGDGFLSAPAPADGKARQGFELKAIPQYQFKAEEGDTERDVTQVFAVFGHVDSVGDRINLGATTKTVKENLRRLRVLWQHDFEAPPIGVPVEVSEKTIDQLPPDAAEFYRAQFPDATGVLMAKVRYLDTPRGNEVLEGIRAGAINENSIGFSTVNGKVGYTIEEGKRIRELFEIKLWDISPVNWGANDATTNLKQIGPLQFSDDDLLAQVEALNPLVAELKEGRVLSEAHRKRLKAALEALQETLEPAEPPAAEHDQEPGEASPDPDPESTLALTDHHRKLMTRLRLAEAELYLTRG